MWRSETLAIVVSSTSMNVASETTTAISQGLRFLAAERGRAAFAAAAIAAASQGKATSGLTDMPGPIG